MLDHNKLIKLLHPPVWLMVLLAAVCTAALIVTFLFDYDTHPLAYVIYVLSFYTLTTIVLACIRTVPRCYRTARQRVYDHPVGERLMTDLSFRTHVSLYGSLLVNLLYVVLNAASGVYYHTVWFFVLAGYYLILAVMRFLLVRFVNRVGIGRNRFRELRRSRLCGCILLTLNLALSAAVLMILYQNKGFSYNGILIYAMAAYTFYITTLAIINLVRYRRLGSPVMSMAKIISMAAALVSVLSLEAAMFAQFGADMSPASRRLMIILTGAGVSAVIVTMSVYSIVKNTVEIRTIMEEEAYEE